MFDKSGVPRRDLQGVPSSRVSEPSFKTPHELAPRRGMLEP